MLQTIQEWIVMAVLTCIWAFAHFLVLGGLFLILHQASIDWLNSPLLVTQNALDLIGPYVIIASLFLVSISIYFEDSRRTPPTDVSKKFSGPFMIILSVIFLVLVIYKGGLSSRYLDALGAIALGGAMMRVTGLPFRI